MAMLNSRQWALYAYLKDRGDQWTKQEDIAYALNEWYRFLESDNFHDSNARLLMTKDIRAINDNEVIQKIIISGSKGIKLANEEEFSLYIKRQYGSVLRRLQRIRHKEKKGAMDGQTRIVFKSERDVIEAFLHSNN